LAGLPLMAALMVLSACDIEDWDIGDSERFTQDFHYNYPMPAGGRLSVENFNGSVEISGWDEPTVDISGTKYAHTAQLRDELKVEIEHAPDSVYIRTVRPSVRRGGMGVKYIIKVPRRTQLERISSTNGSIHTIGIEGSARLKTSNGGVHAENLKGSLDVQTSNGGIDVEGLDGGAALHTTNGHVRAEDVRGAIEADTSNGGIHIRLDKGEPGRSIRLETSNGPIDLSVTALQQNEIRASTSNGGITIHLPEKVDANITASTNNSSITTDFEVMAQGNISKNHLEGRIGAGGPRIDLSTSNGSIKLLKM
jgi:Putative adhesin